MGRCIVSKRDLSQSLWLSIVCPFQEGLSGINAGKQKIWTEDEISAAVFMLGFYCQIIRVCPAFNQWDGLVKFCWSLIYSVMVNVVITTTR